MSREFNIRELLTVVKNAILGELNEAQKLKDIINQQKETINKLNEIVGNLQTELAKTKNEDVKKLLEELGNTETALQEIVSLIGNVNITPVSDALINEVQSNISVSTPGALVSVETAPTTIPESNQVSSAVEALGVSLVNPGSEPLTIGDVLPDEALSTEPTIEQEQGQEQTPENTGEQDVKEIQ